MSPDGLGVPERGPSPRPAFEDAWRARFEEFASLCDDDAGIAGWTASGLQVRFRQFLRVWQQSSHGETWLDAGCGAGTYTRFLAGEGIEVVGLDYSLPSVVKAKARDDGRCTWAVADVTRLPFRGETFDGVLCFGVMQALAESGPAIEALVAQVRPGGELWIDALNGICVANALQRFSRWLRGKPAHLRYESPWRMRRLLKQRGLVDIELHWIPIFPRQLRPFQRLLDNAVMRAGLRHVPGLGAVLSHSCMLIGVVPLPASATLPVAAPNAIPCR